MPRDYRVAVHRSRRAILTWIDIGRNGGLLDRGICIFFYERALRSRRFFYGEVFPTSGIFFSKYRWLIFGPKKKKRPAAVAPQPTAYGRGQQQQRAEAFLKLSPNWIIMLVCDDAIHNSQFPFTQHRHTPWASSCCVEPSVPRLASSRPTRHVRINFAKKYIILWLLTRYVHE